ncbi:unnamed protein product [Lactuca virosa]|uniref:Uncharacterized protein n=1 Tax=Lactuca virosa TaxID=75947 RepID=A0AAU9MTN5_9ASTR|nr:unnamed protein product [Lactuca virosa]
MKIGTKLRSIVKSSLATESGYEMKIVANYTTEYAIQWLNCTDPKSPNSILLCSGILRRAGRSSHSSCLVCLVPPALSIARCTPV